MFCMLLRMNTVNFKPCYSVGFFNGTGREPLFLKKLRMNIGRPMRHAGELYPVMFLHLSGTATLVMN